MGGSTFQRIHDLVEMPLRVRVSPRVPRDFLTENGSAIEHRGYLAITGAQIKTDPAAIEMASEWGREFLLGRQIFADSQNHFKGLFVNLIAHDRGVEAARC